MTSLRVILSLVTIFCYLFDEGFSHTGPSKHNNLTGWENGCATWYGDPEGCGTTGGACGYAEIVSKPPWDSFVTAAGPSLYLNGKECGACYRVKCKKHPACSARTIPVVITDSCPGCSSNPPHFDLSGKAFGAMAKPGMAQALRNAGKLDIKFVRVTCDYPGKSITFKVDPGSSPYYVAVVIEYEEGDGDVSCVQLKDSAGIDKWCDMTQSWGAVWKLDAPGRPLKAPFSIKVTSQLSKKVILAENVIPANWKPGATYTAPVKDL